jgi:hypothetical protein
LSLLEVCDSILGVHEGIRWVKLIDPKGRIVFEKKKEHVEPYLTQYAMENLRGLWITIIQGIVGNVAKYWGPPQHLHIQFKKVMLFGFPYVGGSMVVTAEPDVPLTMIGKIQEILSRTQEVG